MFIQQGHLCSTFFADLSLKDEAGLGMNPEEWCGWWVLETDLASWPRTTTGVKTLIPSETHWPQLSMRVMVLSCSLERAVGRGCDWCLWKPSLQGPAWGIPRGLRLGTYYTQGDRRVESSWSWREGWVRVEETGLVSAWFICFLHLMTGFIFVVWSCFLFERFLNCDSHPWPHSWIIWGTFKTCAPTQTS